MQTVSTINSLQCNLHYAKPTRLQCPHSFQNDVTTVAKEVTQDNAETGQHEEDPDQ